MNHVTLIGAEDVRNAGNRMVAAAEDMQRAANVISESLTMNQRFMEDWLQRLEKIMEKK